MIAPKYSILFDKEHNKYIDQNFTINDCRMYNFIPIGIKNFNLCNEQQYADIEKWSGFVEGIDKNKEKYLEYKNVIINKLGSMFLQKICDIKDNIFTLLPNKIEKLDSQTKLRGIQLVYNINKFNETKSKLLSEINLPNFEDSCLMINNYDNSLNNINIGNNNIIKFNSLDKNTDKIIIPKLNNISLLEIYDNSTYSYSSPTSANNKKIILNGINNIKRFNLDLKYKSIEFLNDLNCEEDINIEASDIIFSPDINLISGEKININICGYNYNNSVDKINYLKAKYLDLSDDRNNFKINVLETQNLSLRFRNEAVYNINKLVLNNPQFNIKNANTFNRGKYMTLNINSIKSNEKVIELVKDNHIIVKYKGEEVKKGRIYV